MLKPGNLRWIGIAMAFGLAVVVMTDSASAAQRRHRTRKATTHKKVVARRWTGAENGLIGIKLYDNAERVISIYGSPDQVEAIGGGGAAFGGGGPGAGMGMGPGGPGGPGKGMMPGRGGPRGMAGGGPTGGASGAGFETDAFGWADSIAINQSAGPGAPMAPPGSMGPGSGAGPGNRGPMGPGGQGFGGGKGGPGGGIPGTNGGASDRVTLTRWVYNRGGSKYGFIVDKSGRVVQIEAIGLDNSQVKTKRGVGFGSTFSSIFSDYAQPDGYEISGENLMMKYLVHDNVAFRLSRLGPKKPQVVTGIVVAAGKS